MIGYDKGKDFGFNEGFDNGVYCTEDMYIDVEDEDENNDAFIDYDEHIKPASLTDD